MEYMVLTSTSEISIQIPKFIYYYVGKKVVILPETFFVRVHEDITLEQTVSGNFEDVDYLVSASFFRHHWTLVLLDIKSKYILYLDPMKTYVPKAKQKKDLDIVKRIIWYRILNMSLDSSLPNDIPGWYVITTEMYR